MHVCMYCSNLIGHNYNIYNYSLKISDGDTAVFVNGRGTSLILTIS